MSVFLQSTEFNGALPNLIYYFPGKCVVRISEAKLEHMDYVALADRRMFEGSFLLVPSFEKEQQMLGKKLSQ